MPDKSFKVSLVLQIWGHNAHGDGGRVTGGAQGCATKGVMP